MLKSKLTKVYFIIILSVMLVLISIVAYDKLIKGDKQDVAEKGADINPASLATSAAVVEETDKSQGGISQDKSKLNLEIKLGNSWENGGKKYSQIDVIVKNNNASEASGWSVDIPVASNAKVDQIWNAVYNLENGKLTFKPAQHNDKIPSNGNISFGCILIDAGSINTGLAKLECKVDDLMASTTGQGNGNSENNSSQNNASGNTAQYVQPSKVNAKGVPPPSTDDWLHTKGNKIVDKNGKEVWLTGVNWFGYNTGTNVFDGLWAADLNTSLTAIADRGFNLLRIPISSELILKWATGKAPEANFNKAANSYLVGMNSLEIFDYVVGQCRANGIKIMIDIHSAKTDAMGHMKPVWYEDDISEKDYLDSLSWMAERYRSDDTIIAFDLKNEPHGKPDEKPRAIWNNSKDPNNWKYIAEKAANAVLSKNPNVLIMVEGIEIYPIDVKKNSDYKSTNKAEYYFNWWGGNLRGVKDYPIDLGKNQDQLVYSPHDYGPSVFEQPWFKSGYTYESLYKDCWKDNWMYIHEKNTAPLLIGEWGGFMKEPNLTWMTHLRKLIKSNKLNHTFWCFNSNSGDTGGLVLGDFVTWDEQKYKFVKDVLWQKNGKFVGLDHQIPLGKNGITLSSY
ncbi:cellulase family glycosylhydrolase [Pseudobacteroides cellulosolvens]|uniref:Endoglucanase n=1 Tax=Pseudobacteroides cellulosolvens ATCC 35603 = DSM 2933 TaxID=398512 RepID=A0A0L6JU12_9FIRM|nr:cellulase family glycosylhydrolase [Pseudobacteroides cellulosolvens]KNY28917.1 glycoside hydrolase family 5 [Pseudobacteroides cellulosolvens ATCC 35603 = DSM 2933]